MKIGLFDSGVGGLTVLKEALKIMPNENYVYVADTYNVPYGMKTKKEVEKLISNIIEFINKKNIDALVIACNTATSICVTKLRSKYNFPIIGMEPAVKYALKNNNNKKVLVLATALTLKEEKYKNLLKKLDCKSKVKSIPLPKLVEFAENYNFDEDTVSKYLNNIFSEYNLDEFGAIVLGCTHFVYYKNIIQKIVPDNIKVLDGNQGTINHLNNILKDKTKNKTKGTIEFYQTSKEGFVTTDFEKYMNLLK